VAFEQAGIKVEKEKEFGELKRALTSAFSSGNVEKFLKRVAQAGIRIRDFELLLARGIFEQVDPTLAGSERSAKNLYDALVLTDQAQLKEFYLFKLEEVGPELRARFHKLYQYY
jgi:hypothetical protein